MVPLSTSPSNARSARTGSRCSSTTTTRNSSDANPTVSDSPLLQIAEATTRCSAPLRYPQAPAPGTPTLSRRTSVGICGPTVIIYKPIGNRRSSSSKDMRQGGHLKSEKLAWALWLSFSALIMMVSLVAKTPVSSKLKASRRALVTLTKGTLGLITRYPMNTTIPARITATVMTVQMIAKHHINGWVLGWESRLTGFFGISCTQVDEETLILCMSVANICCLCFWCVKLLPFWQCLWESFWCVVILGGRSCKWWGRFGIFFSLW